MKELIDKLWNMPMHDLLLNLLFVAVSIILIILIERMVQDEYRDRRSHRK